MADRKRPEDFAEFVLALLVGVLVGILLNFVYSIVLILARGSQAPMRSGDFGWVMFMMLLGLACGVYDYWRGTRERGDDE